MISRSLLLYPALLGAFTCVGILALPCRVHAQQPAPAFDPAAVLSTLKDLKSKQAAIISREQANVMAALNAAIRDPGKAYEQAVMAVEIQGSGANEGSRVMEWRKRNGALLRERAFLEAARLHLTYLALTWQHASGMKIKDQLPALLDYIAQVTNDGDPILEYEVFKKPVTGSIFTTYFQLGPFLSKGSADWEDRPFEVDGIYRKAILPQMRADKDPRVLDYWAARIQRESTRAGAQNDLAANRAKSVLLPTLFWDRAEDEFAMGMVNQAVADMMVQIKAHPDHPDFDRWVNRVTEIVTPPKGEVTVSPGTSQ